jgi:hypothetical protein
MRERGCPTAKGRTTPTPGTTQPYGRCWYKVLAVHQYEALLPEVFDLEALDVFFAEVVSCAEGGDELLAVDFSAVWPFCTNV